MSMEDQVISLFCGTEGFLDEVPTDSILAFEKAFLAHVAEAHPQLAEAIRTTGTLSDEVAEALRVAVTAFLKDWQAVSA